MNIEEVKLTRTFPLITEEEIRIIDNNINNIVDEYMNKVVKDKDLAISQYIIKKQKNEIDKLNEQNNDLRRIYRNTYKKLYENGNNELAGYFQAQINECPTFYVEQIIDYYQEYYRLNNIINKLEKHLEENIEYYSDDEYGLILTERGDYYTEVLNKLKELKDGNNES